MLQMCRSLGHQLVSISLNHMELPDVALKPIAGHCRALQTLHISSREMTGETLKPFFAKEHNAHLLKNLSLMCCYKVSFHEFWLKSLKDYSAIYENNLKEKKALFL